MRSKPPQPAHKVGDIVVAAREVLKKCDGGTAEVLFKKGNRLRIVTISEFYGTLKVHGINEPDWRTFPVLASEITKPPKLPRKP